MKRWQFIRKILTAVSFSLSILAISTSTQAATLTAVDTELTLLVDVSGSIDDREFDLQTKGYVNTFLNPNLFKDFISKGPLGKIAVNMIYWSNSLQQQEVVGWSLIDSVAASQQFANAISATKRPFSGTTAPGSAIAFATPKFFNNDFEGTRQVIDVSGDGEENDGIDTASARNLALAQGIDAINGIIISSDPVVKNFYLEEILGGVNGDGSPAFLVEAATFEEFNTAIDKKIKAEIRINSTPITADPPTGNTNPIPITVDPPTGNTNPVPVTVDPPTGNTNPVPVTTDPPATDTNPVPVTADPPATDTNQVPVTVNPTSVPEASSILGLLAFSAVSAGSMRTRNEKRKGH